MRQALEAIAKEAGDRILKFYPVDDLQIQNKGDGSPVTAADLAAHEHIQKELEKQFELPVVSEESFDESVYPPKHDSYWLVDPLDGTKDFIKGTDHFTVNIALIESGKSIAGVVYIPCTGDCYSAFDGQAWKNGEKISTTRKNQEPVVATSHFHKGESLLDFIKNNDYSKTAAYGSSLKFCLLAEGSIDIYPRLSPTSHWDTAAGQAVAEAAGCLVVEHESRQPLRYKNLPIINPNFIAHKPDLKWI